MVRSIYVILLLIVVFSRLFVATKVVTTNQYFVPTPAVDFFNAIGGYLPLALGVSSVRYPIRQLTFKYVATVQSVTDETCQSRHWLLRPDDGLDA